MMIYYFKIESETKKILGVFLEKPEISVLREQTPVEITTWNTRSHPRYLNNADGVQIDRFAQLIPNLSYFINVVEGGGGDIRYYEDVSEADIDHEIRQQFDVFRLGRNDKLSKCDWTQLSDAPLSDDQKIAWQEYRQALRDLPDNTTNPFVVEWPPEPE